MDMKTFDRIMELSPDAAMLGNPHYEVYRIGLKWLEVGGIAVTVGLMAAGLHIELGKDIAAGGAAVLWLGGGVVAAETSNLTDY
jgi:hypothetical protein